MNVTSKCVVVVVYTQGKILSFTVNLSVVPYCRAVMLEIVISNAFICTSTELATRQKIHSCSVLLCCSKLPNELFFLWEATNDTRIMPMRPTQSTEVNESRNRTLVKTGNKEKTEQVTAKNDAPAMVSAMLTRNALVHDI